MKKIFTTAVSAVIFLFVGASGALAQEEESDDLNAVPVETFTCDFNEGKGPGDLNGVIEEWNAWMDSTGQTSYFAATLWPHYFGELAFDVGWLGAWPDANAMGAGTDHWLTNGGEVGAKFGAVLDCTSHTNYVSINVKESPDSDDDSDNKFVLTFSNCSVEEGKTFDDVLAAQDTWNAYADENGFIGGAWILWAIYGGDNEDYDFKYVESSPDYTTFGADYQRYSDGAYLKAEEIWQDVMDCDSGRVYSATAVRSMKNDDD